MGYEKNSILRNVSTGLLYLENIYFYQISDPGFSGGYDIADKGLVINYGEGGGYKMGKSRVWNFLCPPPPQDRVKVFAPPLLKSGNFSRPPTVPVPNGAVFLKAMPHQPTRLNCWVGSGPVCICVMVLQLNFLYHSSSIVDCLVGLRPT